MSLSYMYINTYHKNLNTNKQLSKKDDFTFKILPFSKNYKISKSIGSRILS